MSSDSPTDPPTWTLLKLLRWTTDYLRRNGVEQPRIDAEIMLAHILGCQRIDLYLRHDQPVEAGELGRFKPLLQRRRDRCPVAYLLGEKEFWSLNIKVTPDVLIPRPETECLVETVLARYAQDTELRVLELGTGSGAIAIALAAERPHWTILATDISADAISIARGNAGRHNVDRRIEFRQGFWFQALDKGPRRFHLIVSNPPYIASRELTGLAPEIRKHEPIQALDGGPDGLDCLRHIIDESPDHLAPGGSLALEIGSDQGAAVRQAGRARGTYADVEIFKDYSGLDRVARLMSLPT